MLLFSLLALPALAAQTTFDASVAGGYWPLGLRFSATPGLKFPLWNQEDSVLFGDTFLQLECLCQATPAYGRIGPSVTFSPIAVFDVTAHYVVSSYFGTFSSLIGFDDPDTVWTDEVLDAEIDAGRRGTGWATRWGTDATLKAKAGPVIVALNGELLGWNIHAADNVEGQYVYEPQMDLMLAWKDQVRSTSAVLLVEKGLPEERTMRLGLLDSTSKALSTDSSIHRIGPLWTLDSGVWSYLALVQAQLEHQLQEVVPPYLAFQVKYTMP